MSLPSSVSPGPPPAYFPDDEEVLSTWTRFSQKFKDQPLVPLGAGATTIALLGAGRALRAGNATQFNVWLRYRVVFQGLTVLAALGGSLYYNHQRDLDRAGLEAERIKRREIRMQEQEQSYVNQTNERDNEIGSEARRSLLLRKVAEQAQLEGRALRIPSRSGFKDNYDSKES
ncbi:hypothetical protein CROQUDRAFT_672320 [Cronartium quercuum f. sp. fusiforme G11]|uniref:HIG1 domain-containing protein n=1 Tax=Cronartium quercuum f. sp. fusiforme G11 TaxID=708437 RepID=A0A9P6ND66_9BASI|nr:hypothetical protein CROQUDRAFT_672320 [Cronartium quercuum f. sp. fusiforme G11]